MKITKTILKEMILEALKEGDVIRGPWSGTPAPNPDLINFVNGLEDLLGKKLEGLHGQQPMDIPVDKFEQLEIVMTEIGRLLDLGEH
jgi:hypothetical protein